MVPKMGDIVKMTKEYVDYDVNFKQFENKKLEIMKVSLGGIGNGGPFYIVYFVSESYLRKITIDKSGCKDAYPVFELWEPAGYSPIDEPSEDDICKNCGATGEVKGMACVCPNCGSLVWGI